MRLTHVFVDSFPEPLEDGKLYVSMQFASVAHLCACGCGSEVVTPIRRRGWLLTFDGESITLSPSVGNHGFACQSHYFIRKNEIEWAGKLSSEDIRAGRIENRQGGMSFDEFKHDEAKPLDEFKGDEPKSEEQLTPPVSELEQPEPEKRRQRKWWDWMMFWRR